MREIKFRGMTMGGHFVYGLLTKKRIRNSGELAWAIAAGNFTGAETVPVIEETIAQLVGHDSQGAEIYEGDTLTDGSGNSYIAVLERCVEWKYDSNDSIFRRMPIKFAKKFTKLTLVEAAS